MNEVLNCDEPGCGHVEHVGTITEDMIGMRCPKCGSDLLTADDYEGWAIVKMLVDAATEAVGEPDPSDLSMVEMRVKLHEGKLDIEFQDPLGLSPTGRKPSEPETQNLPMSSPGDKDYEC